MEESICESSGMKVEGEDYLSLEDLHHFAADDVEPGASKMESRASSSDASKAVQSGRNHLSGMPEFILHTWQMLNVGHPEVSWSEDGRRIEVHNPERLARDVLPKYFRHSQYTSFVRALNAYTFKKVGTGQWYHPNFQRDKPHLLRQVARKSVKGANLRRRDPNTTLAVATSHAPGSLLQMVQQERHRLWNMSQAVTELEAEVRKLGDEEFKMRFDTVHLMQLMLSRISRSPSSPVDLLINARLSPAAASNTALTLTHEGNERQGMPIVMVDDPAAGQLPGLELFGGLQDERTGDPAEEAGREDLEMSAMTSAATVVGKALEGALNSFPPPGSSVRNGFESSMSRDELEAVVNYYFERLTVASDQALQGYVASHAGAGSSSGTPSWDRHPG